MGTEGFVTVQTRLRLPPEIEVLFERYSERYGRDLGRLHRLIRQGISFSQAKVQFGREGLTARQFSGIAFDLRGRTKSRDAAWERELRDKERRIQAIERKLKLPPQKKGYSPTVAHQKKRKLHRLRSFLKQAERRVPPLIFGGKKLWNAQHHLSENGFSSHEAWKAAWREARSSEFFLVGSRGESRGNQSCQLDLSKETLQVRFPDALGGALLLRDVSFRYGKEILEQALAAGIAISYRFVRKKKGAWYVLASTRPAEATGCTSRSRGAIGVDVGPGRISMVDTDPQGNLLFRKTFRLPLRRKTKNQARAQIEKVAQEIGIWGHCTGKPVVLETLDFEEKKALLKERGKGYARMLSSFAYGTMIQAIRSRCARNGVEVIAVSPAYTSVIGIIKYSAMYGLSGDEAAAFALARRGLDLGEAPPARTALARPEDRAKHVGSRWRCFEKALGHVGRHAFISAKRGSGGGPREYPALPARASPASKRRVGPRAVARSPGGRPGENLRDSRWP